jgi:hypothetical protein
MLRYFIWASLIFLSFNIAFASNDQNDASSQKVEKTHIGIYVTHISSINIKQKTVNALFWLWYVTPVNKPKITPKQIFIPNAQSYTIMKQKSVTRSDNTIWNGFKIKATLFQNWRLDHYPFDSEKIKIIIEDYYLSAKPVKFIADRQHSGFDDNMSFNGWHFENQQLKTLNALHTNDFLLNTDSKGSLGYTQATYQLEAENDNIRAYIKLFGLLFLASLIVFCMFFVPITDLRARLALISSAIFAIVGNILATNETMPSTSALTLVDQSQAGILIYMIGVLLLILLNYHIYQKSKKTARIINICLAVITMTLMITIKQYFIRLD